MQQEPENPVVPSAEQICELPAKAEDLCEKDQESDILDEENDDESKGDNTEGYNGSGRTVTLQMLLAANVLQPGKSTMTIEYLGQKFVGDLLPDGKIKSQETETIFLSPSAWAMHCKRIINPEKKSGCGWASVKYKGKKLDAYKATWMRKCALQKESTPSEDEHELESEKKSEASPPPVKRPVLPHNSISNRNVMHDANLLIESVPFATINKMQPFLLTITSSALLLADFHCHLTFHEVCGYFGGQWDVNSHTLTITKAFPCRNTRFDRQKAGDVEMEIQKAIMKEQLILVGWYHSHPKFQSQPTLRDCDAQLDYQIKMRGLSEVTYTPCVGFIFSPYYEENASLESSITSFWVIPPPENRQMIEYGRPMQMQYTVSVDNEISSEVRCEMQNCVEYYSKFRNELVSFTGIFKDDTSYLDLLKSSLYPRFPKNENDREFWNWICRLLKCPEEEEFILPIGYVKMQEKEETNAEKDKIKLEEGTKDEKATDLKVLSLQEQLCLPSGLNMNPTRLASPLATTNSACANTTTSSPRDSPITIPSNSASPAKFEMPIRASPSPAKSDTSSSRTRNSPAPSPGKLSISDISRNSPSLTPNKYDPSCSSSMNDLVTASLASLTGLPQNFLSNDLNAFFQQQQKDYGNSSLNQLAAAAAKVGNKSAAEHMEKNCDNVYSSGYNMSSTPKAMDHSTPKASPKQDPRAMKASGSSYKTKLMKELEDLKNDPIKISELMRSPEYAALLLQQAEALGATTLGSLGFGNDFSFLGSSSVKKAAPSTDYSNLLQASKLLGYDAYMQQTKSSNDLNNFFQQHMTSSSSSSKKQQQSQLQPDYTALLQTYSKLFDTSNSYSSKSNVPPELSALLGAGTSSSAPSKKKDTQSDMLNQLLQSDSSLLYQQNKAASDLNALFVSPSVNSQAAKAGNDVSSYYSQLTQEKIQDYAAFFQTQHGKYGIPDPLSKSTLAANNMFMSPSALLKLQQDSLNAMMMKPPKSSAASSSRIRESSASPAQERLTPTKSNRESPASSGMKYNFSAVDLAISSVSPGTPSPSPSEGSRRPSDTPPVDLSRMYQEPPHTKKRMEFSSIADLAAPPTKVLKPTEREEVLNLSSND